MIVGEKFDAFLDNVAEVEFLEGTTAAGKTTVGIFKFMMEVAESPKKLHIISGLDTGTIEKNIINKDHGIMDEWGVLVEYNGNGTAKEKLPHILFRPSGGVEKIIYVLGYDDKQRWKKALGGQYGCLYIDELNIANIDFVRESMMRCDYMMGTLNPDDPNLPVYKEYVNCSRPLPEWQESVPKEIMNELKEEPKPGWVFWFFSFDDNVALSEEKKKQIMRNVPVGTKLYKNKIEGIRCKATGLVFGNFEYDRNVRTESWVNEELEKNRRYEEGVHNEDQRGFKWVLFTSAMDTSYSKESEDTISMMFQGITDTGILITLDEEVINNKNLNTPVSPSDVCERYVAFLERNRKKWGFSRYNFIDSADQATLREMEKYVARTGSIYNFDKSYKKKSIMDRIILQRGWIQDGYYIVLSHCEAHLGELNNYSYIEEKGIPEDRNDHTINANQYAWLPYIGWIGQR